MNHDYSLFSLRGIFRFVKKYLFVMIYFARGSYAYSIICAHLCSHSPEFEILIGLTQMDFNSSRLCLSAWVIGDVIHARI